jgi:2-polyprenyl-3-methyl-5-hydroxy-6-metoxy-1,4-benzoquinol methylase
MDELDRLMSELRTRLGGVGIPSPVQEHIGPRTETRAMPAVHGDDRDTRSGQVSAGMSSLFSIVADAAARSTGGRQGGADGVAAGDHEAHPGEMAFPIEIPELVLAPVAMAPLPVVQVEEGERLAPEFGLKDGYDLREFLALTDWDFVHAAYVGLLGREPDLPAASKWIDAIRMAQLSRPEVLWHIANSPEGKARGTKVQGLWAAYALRRVKRWPVVGYAVGWLQYLAALPRLARRVEFLETEVASRERILRDAMRRQAVLYRDALAESQRLISVQAAAQQEQVARLASEVAPRVAVEAIVSQLTLLKSQLGEVERGGDRLSGVLEGTIAEIRRITDQVHDLDRLAEDLQLSAERFRGEVGRCEEEIEALRSEKAGRDQLQEVTEQAGRDKRELREAIEESARAMGEALRVIGESGKESAGGIRQRLDALLQQIVQEYPDLLPAIERSDARARQDDELDAFYKRFEDRFRGTRDDIMNRVRVYLPTIRAAGAGSADAPVLDVGCGRGEWLELLSTEGASAIGVDLSPTMVRECTEMGLKVVCDDAIEYLAGAPEGAFGAVTGFHIIEHLPFRRFIELLDATLRALRTGGVAVFETPNPENLVVGSCNFWYDPTHRAPLPPEMVRWVAESRGFARAEILRLHPVPESEHLREGAAAVRSLLNQKLYGPQDYALVAYKG